MPSPDRHVIVDGSNIATEGRSLPSLDQLDEAVRAFQSDHPDASITVVVDATFAHRIAKKERKAFDAAVDAGEIIVPPAGAIGRGDAFILQVAAKGDAEVLSNDSFQEFHGEHRWLFDEGRLIGAKPVRRDRLGVSSTGCPCADPRAAAPPEGPRGRRRRRPPNARTARNPSRRRSRKANARAARNPSRGKSRPPSPRNPGRGRRRGRRPARVQRPSRLTIDGPEVGAPSPTDVDRTRRRHPRRRPTS